tara:strand:- start:998 stop:2248 length:1251 start_codon:yes stop_codon:yes gene_type:complete
MKNKFQLLLLFLAHISAGIASGIAMISIPWYFTNNLDLNSAFSLMFGIVTFIGLFWGLYSGVIIDKFNRKSILEIINIFFGLLITCISFLILFLNPEKKILTVLVGSVFAITCFYYIIYYPTIYAFLQEISEKKNYVKINSYVEIVGQTTTVLAGSLAAILLSGIVIFNFKINPWPIENILLLDGISYLTAALIISFIKHKPKKNKIKEEKSIINRMKVGFKYLNRNRLILLYAVCSHIIFAFLLVELFTLLPILIKNYFQKEGHLYAITDICYALGALLSGFFIYKLINYFNKIKLTIILILLTSISLIILISNKYIISLLIISVFIGIANSGVRIIRNSFLFDNIPNVFIGRVTSIFNSINTTIRMILIFIFSLNYFSMKENVTDGYLLCAIILIVFCLPIIFYYKKLKSNCVI